MNFRDMWATTADGKSFIFTVEMQRQLSEQGLPVEPASLAQLAGKPAPPPAPAPREREPERPRPPKPAPESQRPTPPAAEMTVSAEFEEPDSIKIDPTTGKYIGRIKWYNAIKGFGFIARGGGEDIFFHKSDALCEAGQLVEGGWILYDVEQTQKGLEASEVEVYSNA